MTPTLMIATPGCEIRQNSDQITETSRNSPEIRFVLIGIRHLDQFCRSSRFRARTPSLRRTRMAEQPPSTVLIVEDDPRVAQLDKQRLENVGYRIVTAGTAADA